MSPGRTTDESTYPVSEIFYSIQGEGFHAGLPAIFLRFGQCNLWPSPDAPSKTCSWCDTAQLHTFQRRTLDELSWLVYREKIGRPSAVGLVLTGGEPLMWLDDVLIEALCEWFPWIDVETNGTLPLKFAKPKNLFISCSPKTPKIVVEADWWKLLVPDKLDLLEKIIDSQKPIYLQPVEPRMPDGSVDHEAFQRNIAQCARLAMSDGYRVCLQLHKILNLR